MFALYVWIGTLQKNFKQCLNAMLYKILKTQNKVLDSLDSNALYFSNLGSSYEWNQFAKLLSQIILFIRIQ